MSRVSRQRAYLAVILLVAGGLAIVVSHDNSPTVSSDSARTVTDTAAPTQPAGWLGEPVTRQTVLDSGSSGVVPSPSAPPEEIEEIIEEIAQVITDPESGDATVFLQVVDEQSGLALASQIGLWRMGLGADETWSKGDGWRGNFSIPITGMKFTDLPLGRYRALVHAARRGTPDPPEFEVTADSQDVLLRIQAPTVAPIRIRLWDENQRELMTVTVSPVRETSQWRDLDSPLWASPRALRTDSLTLSEYGGVSMDFYTESVEPRWRMLNAGAHGFELGRASEASRGGSSIQKYKLRLEGSSTCAVDCPTVLPLDWNFVGVLVDMDAVLPRIIAPWNADGRDFAEHVHVTSKAVLVKQAPTAPDPRDIPIQVTVDHPDSERMVFEFTLNDLPLANHYLVPRGPASQGSQD